MATTVVTEAEERAALDDLFGDPVDPKTQAELQSAEDDRIVQQGLAVGGGGGGGSDLGVASAGSNQVRDDLGIEYSADLGDAGPFQIDDPRWEGASLYSSQKEPTASQAPKRQLPENISLSLITNEDLRSLADSATLPKFLEGTVYEAQFGKARDPFEREDILRKATRAQRGSAAFAEKRDAFLQHEKTAQIGAPIVAGGAVVGGAAAAGVPILSSVAQGIGPFASWVAGSFPYLVKGGGLYYVAKSAYDDIMADPQITEEKAQRMVEEEVQNYMRAQKDTGTPPVSDATKDTGKTAQ
tara:strand:+ start:11453 stop:12346 length:894 start_codon:yes stop_codon:yes gene_type:complete